MASVNAGKDFVCGWIRLKFPKESTILDVGACDGKWRTLLHDYPNMDACEAWKPNCDNIRNQYQRVCCCEIADLRYKWYDLIIFGDVLEHMDVPTAQGVLNYAAPRCKDLIICVPWQWKQGPYNGNPYEEHIQDDLTPEIFAQRYPGFEVLHDPGDRICYYHKKQKDED